MLLLFKELTVSMEESAVTFLPSCMPLRDGFLGGCMQATPWHLYLPSLPWLWNVSKAIVLVVGFFWELKHGNLVFLSDCICLILGTLL